MYGERRWSWWREKKNSSLLSTVDELRESSANLWHERESANDQTFNWNLSEVRDKCNWLNYHPPKHCHCVCCLFIHFLCQLQSQHSALATDTFHRVFFGGDEITLIVSVSPSFFISSGADYVFTIIKMKKEKRWKFHSTAVSEAAQVAAASWQPTTSRRQLQPQPTATRVVSSLLRSSRSSVAFKYATMLQVVYHISLLPILLFP